MNGNVAEVEKIKRFGRVLKRLTLFLMTLAPVVAVLMVARQGPLLLVNVPQGITVDAGALTYPGALAVVAVGLLTPATYFFGFVILYRLFDLYAQGVVFSRRNVVLIRRAGYVLMAVDVVRVLQAALTGPVLFLLGAARGYITVRIGISTLVVGLAIVLISHVMDLGCKIYERDQLTI